MNKLVDAIFYEIQAEGGHRNKLSIARQIERLDGRHGWKLVPVRADKNILKAAGFPAQDEDNARRWVNMLAASPDPLGEDDG